MTDFLEQENAIVVHIGKRIRQRRRILGLTQTELAEKCEVLFQQIQKYECGANRIHATRLWMLAQALGVNTDYFFSGLPKPDDVAPKKTSHSSVRRNVIEIRKKIGDSCHR